MTIEKWDDISTFKNIISDYTDASDEMKEITALTTISAIIGRRFILPSRALCNNSIRDN